MSEQPIPLTDKRDDDLTEAEAGIVVLTDEDVPRTEADVKRAVAAALAPIQALRDTLRREGLGYREDEYSDGLRKARADAADRLDAALAAAGVDAAPNETDCTCGHGADRHDGSAGGCIECRCRAAVPSGHEQEGDHHG